MYGAIAMCMAGVLCITQPSFLGFTKNERSLIGVFFACSQVSGPLLQSLTERLRAKMSSQRPLKLPSRPLTRKLPSGLSIAVQA